MLRKSKQEAEPTAPTAAKPAPGESHIAVGTRIEGDCETTGRLRVDGHVTGNVHAASLVLSRGAHVHGDVVGPADGGAESEFVVDGRVDGAVRASRVEVRERGDVRGGVFADQAVVHGRVSGGIVAQQRLVLEPTGVVEGDVRARRLALKEGGQVNGTIQMGEQAAS